MEMTAQIWVAIGFIVYYSGYMVYDDFLRAGMATNNKNRIIERLRSEYKVIIKTFQSSKPLYGFAWFKSIWLNEILFKSEKGLLFAFYHEYYHLRHNHKFWTLFMRFIVSISPLTKYFVNWLWVVGIILVIAWFTAYISEIFEKKANEYAYKKLKE